MAVDFIRRCPSCDTENPADSMRCVCGAMLLGVDISPKLPAAVAQPGNLVERPAGGMQQCPYADCRQANPPGVSHCVYCARALTALVTPPATRPSSDSADDNPSLPASLATRYKPSEIFQPMEQKLISCWSSQERLASFASSSCTV